MVLNRYRKNADSVLTKLAKPFTKIHPNTLTLISLIFAFAGGLFYYMSFLWAAFGAIVMASLFDALDGKVARMRGIASKKGDFLDHLVDRYADMFIIIGIALSPYSKPIYGLLALSGVFMTSYVGTQSQAVGAKRDYGGVLGRADRMVILMILPVIQYLWWGYIFSASTWVLFIFAILGHLTAVQRILRVWKHLSS